MNSFLAKSGAALGLLLAMQGASANEYQALIKAKKYVEAEKAASAFASPVIVAVVSSPVDSPKIPRWEQELSAGAVCLSLLNAALGAGWGAAWLSGPATDAAFSTAHLGVRGGERVVGMIHIGSRTGEVPDRPRPDVPAKTVFL